MSTPLKSHLHDLVGHLLDLGAAPDMKTHRQVHFRRDLQLTPENLSLYFDLKIKTYKFPRRISFQGFQPTRLTSMMGEILVPLLTSSLVLGDLADPLI